MAKPRYAYDPAPLSVGARHLQPRPAPRGRPQNLRRLCVLALLLRSANGGRSAAPTTEISHATQTGLASYYGKGFHGQETASGATFDKHACGAAQPRFPLGTRARVTNLETINGSRCASLIAAPRPPAEGVLIDLSEGAAKLLDLPQAGRVKVRVEVLEWSRQ